ncbi:GNAT family N-acetyltransferase [Pelomonas sp. KK5]|uniref:GNAT family N-acetyltransferase n=1 Tax=Pelomonas sp. KK5 TaxID=1855730 RepID=UPI00097C7DFC|nr:GNAT family N-acetyltransferase [Pelomonas sp. KK5]
MRTTIEIDDELIAPLLADGSFKTKKAAVEAGLRLVMRQKAEHERLKEFRVTIRRLDPDDSLQALTELLHAAYASLAAQGWNFTAVNQSVEVTRQRLEGAQCFVALVRGRLIGTVAVRGPKDSDEAYIADAPPPLYTTPGTAILAQLGVHPDWRGQGVAERLIEAAEAWAKIQGHRQIALDTAEPASALRARYARRGYLEAGAVQWQGKTYRSVLMCKPLAAEPPTEP